MTFIQVAAFLSLLAAACADVSEIVGNNQYLPPSKGYNYDRPNVPFSPSPRPPTPSYRPPPPASPSYAPPTPSYQPPSPTYAPAAPRPTVISRPSAPGPIYTPASAPSATNGVAVGAGPDHHDHDHHEPGMPYDFEYKVKDDYFGTDYSRNEVSDGDVIRGEYRVQLPDGRLQIVKYTADWKNGFNADVSYQGEPQYPAQNTGAASSGSSSYAPAGVPSASAPSSSYGPPNTGY